MLVLAWSNAPWLSSSKALSSLFPQHQAGDRGFPCPYSPATAHAAQLVPAPCPCLVLGGGVEGQWQWDFTVGFVKDAISMPGWETKITHNEEDRWPGGEGRVRGHGLALVREVSGWLLGLCVQFLVSPLQCWSIQELQVYRMWPTVLPSPVGGKADFSLPLQQDTGRDVCAAAAFRSAPVTSFPSTA